MSYLVSTLVCNCRSGWDSAVWSDLKYYLGPNVGFDEMYNLYIVACNQISQFENIPLTNGKTCNKYTEIINMGDFF